MVNFLFLNEKICSLEVSNRGASNKHQQNSFYYKKVAIVKTKLW